MTTRSPGPRLGLFRLAAEFLLLFGGGPLLLLWLRQPGLLFLLLWGGGLGTWFASRNARLPTPHDRRREILRILARFVVFGAALTLLTWLLLPKIFLDLPRHRPRFWAIIMVLYPLLSVWPQEVIYRRFLFTRYAPLFRSAPALIAASGLAFGYAHFIFLNWIAIALTALGGLLFARDYARHRSLPLTCLEHSLYGCLIFTIGLGRFFYTGTAWHHP